MVSETVRTVKARSLLLTSCLIEGLRNGVNGRLLHYKFLSVANIDAGLQRFDACAQTLTIDAVDYTVGSGMVR